MATGTTFIDNPTALKTFLNGLGPLDGKFPYLYVDLEGDNLSRHGSLSLITLLVEPQNKVYLIDVTTLKKDAFTITGANTQNLKKIFESNDIIKVFFDIRTDSDALFSLYGIRVAGIQDLQLMELASRNFSKEHLNGLARCIERDSTIICSEKQKWRRTKDRGRYLFDPVRGGSYAVFDHRPLSPEILEYCVQDVTIMPNLRNVYMAKLCDAWWEQIQLETEARISCSQDQSYNGKGMHMALGPSKWIWWSPQWSELAIRIEVDASWRKTPPIIATTDAGG